MTRNIAKLFLCIIFCINAFYCNAGDTLSSSRKQKLLLGIASVGYATGIAGLYDLWYADYKQTRFHFFNDNEGWLQVDKAGHAFTAYQVARLSSETLQWANISRKKSIWLGSLNSMAFLSVIEVMDGFSDGWGFSGGDFAANILGCALYTSQDLLWKEQKVLLKFSYHYTNYASYKPDVLGKNPAVRLFKDYNGHSYWLSGNLKSIFNNAVWLPSWLNISFGMGAEGMLGANSNSATQPNNNIVTFARYRQFYFSPDLDFSKIRTKSKSLRTLFSLLNCLKFPLPAVEFNSEKGFRLKPLVF